MDTIEARVEALERRVNRYRRMLAILAVALVATVCVAANQDEPVREIVRTKVLEVVSDDGAVVLRADAVADKPNPHGGVTGGGRLMVFDTQGRELVSATPGMFNVSQTRALKEGEEAKGRLSLFAADWGAMIVLLDQNGRLMWKEPTGK
jgi:hypothetical protein